MKALIITIEVLSAINFIIATGKKKSGLAETAIPAIILILANAMAWNI